MAKKSISRKRSAAQRAVDIEDRKIQRAKRITRRTAPPVPFKVPTIKGNDAPQTFHMVARLNRYSNDIGGTTFLAKVPMVITTVPEIPRVVICEGDVYNLQSAAPLTYTYVRTAIAERIR